MSAFYDVSMGTRSLPILQMDDDRRAGTRMGRRRALVLLLVHALIAVHIGMYLSTGSAIAPLEPSEASFTISEGFINAGAIFFVLLILSTLIFGRFFCGWACHVVALQDACQWVLIKLGLRPAAIRARLLMFVPLFAAFWLFGLPIVERVQSAIAGETGPELAWHLTTDDFWRTFPGPVMTIITFAVCGFVAVMVFGSKGFCTYGCPYGGIFAVMDRAARGRIRVNDNCVQSGECTRNCSSGVDVASEVAQFGMVVDPGCMKCMDCVAGCPSEALSYKLSKKTQAKPKRKPEKRVWDFSWGEEILMAVAFAGFFIIYKNLYRQVPLLLAVAIAAILAYALLLAVRLVRRSDVKLQRMVLRRDGRYTAAGFGFAVLMATLLAFSAHGGLIQWHTSRFAGTFDEAQQMHAAGNHQQRDTLTVEALEHAKRLAALSAIPIRGVQRMVGELHRMQGSLEQAIASFERERALSDRSMWLKTQHALALLEAGRADEARARMRDAFEKSYPAKQRVMFADTELERITRETRNGAIGRPPIDMRLMVLSAANRDYPADAMIAVRLCDLLMSAPVPTVRDPARARQVLDAVIAAEQSDAQVLGRLAGFASMDGNPQRAAELADRAAVLAEAAGEAEFAAAMREDAAAYRQYSKQK